MVKNIAKANSNKQSRNELGTIDPTVAGIDIGNELIVASIPDGKEGSAVKEYGTTTDELLRLFQDLEKAGVLVAVMEATGVYWSPLYEILEKSGTVEPILVDARSVKNPPRRKSDVLDCQWIQTLWSNGLLRAAYRPPADRISLRAYVRQRDRLVESKKRSIHQLDKAMQQMNIKLSVVLSDIDGISGMAIMRAIASGETDPKILASLRHGSVKQSQEQFIAALTGNFKEEHVFALRQGLEQYEFFQRQLADCDKLIQSKLEELPNVVETPPPPRAKDKMKNGKYRARRKPAKNTASFDVREILWRKSRVDFTALNGVGDGIALTIFAELGGTDMTPWKSHKHFCSWLKTCSGTNISGGKSRKCKGQPCYNPITRVLRMAAMSAKKTDTYLGAHIRRISSRNAKTVGIKAGANKLAQQLYFMCKNGWEYHEKGADYYEKTNQERILKHLKKRASALGYTLVPEGKTNAA